MGLEISLVALPLCGDLITVLISLLRSLFWLRYEARDVALVAAGSSHLCLLHAHPLATVPILCDRALFVSLILGASPLPPQKEQGWAGSLRLVSPSSHFCGFDKKLNRIGVMRWQVAVFSLPRVRSFFLIQKPIPTGRGGTPRLFSQIDDSTGLQIMFLCVRGLSAPNSRDVRADVALLTWQVLLGGLGSSVRAHRHLHLWAEHGGGPLGAPMRGSHPGRRGASLGHPCSRMRPM